MFKVSPDQRYLAYAVDTAGNELYTVVIKDLHTGTVLREAISGTWTDVEWANDNQTIFYTVLDAARRPSKLFRHRLGSDPHHDVLVYEEGDAAFRLRLSKTRSKAYLLLQVRSLRPRKCISLQTASRRLATVSVAASRCTLRPRASRRAVLHADQ